MTLLTVAVEELQLVVRTVVGLLSCLLLGERMGRTDKTQGMQLGTSVAQISTAGCPHAVLSTLSLS